MAKKPKVKCPVCGLHFYREDEEFVQNGNRYYHKKCYDELSQEEKDQILFYQYAKQLFGDSFNYLLTKKLAEKYKKENGYTYTGMLKALKWTYEIEKMSIEKANGTIGILLYTYEKARLYYYNLYLNQKVNEEKNILDFVPKVKEVEVTLYCPESKPHKLFFEEDNE